MQAKSLKVYCEKYNPEIAVRVNLGEYKKEDGVINVPIIAVYLVLRSDSGIEKASTRISRAALPPPLTTWLFQFFILLAGRLALVRSS